jgi:hypothetical protein
MSSWEEDFSEIKTFIDSLRNSGIQDFRSHFENHPELVEIFLKKGFNKNKIKAEFEDN